MKKKLLFGLVALILGGCSDPDKDPPAFQTPSPFRATSRPYEIKGVWYYPQNYYELDETGIASYYGGRDGTHGLSTASGERFDMYDLTAAHKTLPLPCVALVTNLENGRMVKVKVNDRGPFKNNRVIDLSKRAAEILGFHRKGTAMVQVQTLPEESVMLAQNVKAFEKQGIRVPQFAKAPGRPDLPAGVEQNLNAPFSPSFVAEGEGVRVASRGHNIQSLIESAQSARVISPMPRDPALETRGKRAIVHNPHIYIKTGNYSSYLMAERKMESFRSFGQISIAEEFRDGHRNFHVEIGPFRGTIDADKILDKLIASGHKDARIVIEQQ